MATATAVSAGLVSSGDVGVTAGRSGTSVALAAAEASSRVDPETSGPRSGDADRGRTLSRSRDRSETAAPSRRGERTDPAKPGGRSAPARRNAPAPAERPAAPAPRDIGRALLADFGFSADQFSCLDALWVSESDWRVHADNPTSSAYGIPQALTELHDLPADYMTSAEAQIRWGLGYVRDSYGSPCSAWAFKQANDWY